MTAKAISEKKPGAAFDLLAETMIQALRELADRGEKLSPRVLASSLAQKPELAQMVGPTDRSSERAEAEAAIELARAERLNEQKKELLRRLEEAEEKASQQGDFSKKAVLTLLRLSGSGQEGELGRALDRFKAGMLEELDPEELEDRLREVKNGILQEGSGEDKSGRGLSRLFKPGAKSAGPSPEAALGGLRQTYLDLLGQIDLDLGPEYSGRLARVNQDVLGSDDLDHLLSLRPRITELIHTYAHLVHEEREEAAVFIAEMARRLNEMESHLLVSLDHTKEWSRGENEFRSGFFEQIEILTTKARRSNQLEELRRIVDSRLSSLKTAMEEKQRRDTSLIGRLENELEGLQAEIAETNRRVTETSLENQALRDRLNQDPLTGVLNRSGLEQALEAEMGRFQRYGRVWSLVMIDLDHFKKVNDTFGHPAGDAVLKELVNRLSPLLRKTDLLARYGGEEFVALMPETTGSNAFEVAQKLRQAIEVTEFLHRGRDVPVTISLGVAQVQDKDPDPSSVLARADKALYKAKKGGRNTVKMI